MADMTREALFDAVRPFSNRFHTSAGDTDTKAIDLVDQLADHWGFGKMGSEAPQKPAGGCLKVLEAVTGRKADSTLTAISQAISDHAAEYGLISKAHIAELIAQTAHETGGFTVFSENLNYSAPRLVEVWPGRFPNIAAATPYAHNPEKLAEKVYGGRFGNTRLGDGFKYRGRGMLQLTFHDNYALYGRLTGLDLVNNPDLASDPYDSTIIAMAFFKQVGVNDAIARGDFAKARLLTNGSITTPAAKAALADVARLRKIALEAMG